MKTLAFFDIFDYPLTSLEIWRYLYAPGEQKISLNQIIEALGNPELKAKIGFFRGFYFLAGKQDSVELRRERNAIAEKKLIRLRPYAKYLNRLGAVSGVAVANTLAIKHSRPESDIDLFIIARPHAVWSARFWAILPLYFFGGRPRPGSMRDKFCLSFLVDENHLDILPWKMEQDIYYIYWLATLMPVSGPEVFANFFEKNKWINKYLPNFFPPEMSARGERRPASRLPCFGGRILKAIQLFVMPAALKEAAARHHTDVIISDTVLKFHLNDRRSEYEKCYQKRVAKIIDTV